MERMKGPEVALVEAFLLNARKQRYRELLDSDKGRVKLIRERFRHQTEGDLDPRYCRIIPPHQHELEQIEALLRSKGAPDTCYAISSLEEIDGKTLLLPDALEALVGTGAGFLSCIHGKLAYFEGEASTSTNRYLCERT